MEDLRNPEPVLMADERYAAFFSAFDDTLTCGWNSEVGSKPLPVTSSHIDRVEFLPNAIAVFTRVGKRTPDFQEAHACLKDRLKLRPIPTRAYSIDFNFDGKTYRVAPQSAEAAKAFMRSHNP